MAVGEREYPRAPGLQPQEALEDDWWLRNVHASDRMRALGGISKLTYNKSAFGHEYRFYRKDRANRLDPRRDAASCNRTRARRR